jgi:MFS family permease
MPIAGRIYDRFGPRLPVFIGLTIAAVGCYLLHTIAIDTSRGHLMLLLSVQAAGIGLAMMPIFTSGIAAIPVAQSNIASAFNNVVRNVSGALGVAILTAILTMQRAEQLAGRAALLPANTPTPHLGSPGTPDWLGQWATYHVTELQVFVGAIDDVFLICAALSAVGAVAALLMRSGPAPGVPAQLPPASPADRGPAQDGRAATAAGQQLARTVRPGSRA